MSETNFFFIERRKMLGALLGGGAGLAAAGAVKSEEEKILLRDAPEATEEVLCSGPRSAGPQAADLSKLVEKMPVSKIGDVTLSRMILGGNLIGGWAHARDLMYVSDLIRAYHTKDKIFETFRIAEACGVNTFLTTPGIGRFLKSYNDEAGGKMQLITDTGNDDKTLASDGVKSSIDTGASLIYIIGEATDRFLREGRFDLVGKCLQRIRDEGYPAGIGAHRLEACRKCIELGFVPDFWMKTYHHHRYWSAVPGSPEHDNIYCRRPEETAEFMLERKEPWIAFKTLAAGALQPRDGFRFAFEGGADFICVGMYDFQIVDDVNICTKILRDDLSARKRPWRGESRLDLT